MNKYIGNRAKNIDSPVTQDVPAIDYCMELLRTRGVPPLAWAVTRTGYAATSGSFSLRILRVFRQTSTARGWFFRWDISLGEACLQADDSQTGYADDDEEAKAACEAAFLRLVGCP